MNIFFAIFRFVCLLPCVVHAENKMPPEVIRVLEQIPKIKAGDALGSFLASAKIKAQAKELDGVTSRSCLFTTWTMEDSGKWLLWTSSRYAPMQVHEQSGKHWTERRDEGELFSVSIYYREDTTEPLDFQRHQRQMPYYSGRKVHTKLDTEKANTGQSATGPQSKPEGSDKSQTKSEGSTR
jgi:hypothetical protein